MKKTQWLWIGIICLMSAVSNAQTKKDVTPFVIYKWTDGKITHYSTIPPRTNMGSVTKLDKDGLVISEDVSDSMIIQPIRPRQASDEPTQSNYNSPQTSAAEKSDLPKGTITKEQRCKDAQNNLKILQGQKQPVREDENGNLVPLNADEVKQQQQEAQSLINRLCQ